MGLNENIFRILSEKNMTQKEFSLLTKIPESTISDWKRKGKTPGTDKLMIISKTLGVSVSELISGDVDSKDSAKAESQNEDYILNDDEKKLIEIYRAAAADQRARILEYFTRLSAPSALTDNIAENSAIAGMDTGKSEKTEVFSADTMLLSQKILARRLRKLAKLDRLVLDESEHASGLNLHLLKYLDYIGVDKLEYIKQYLSNIQPFMISEIASQEKFDNAICVLDDFYRISVYIKVDATKGEEIVVSFHENNVRGIAKRNPISNNLSYVYVFADSIGSHVEGTNDYSINMFVTRGTSTFPINVPASRYDEDGFLVRYSYINNAIISIANRYLEDLYTSDVDYSRITLFSSLQQLSFTSYGRDIFSNISLLVDSLIIQPDTIGRQVADTALCIYCSNLELLSKDKEELISTLRERYKVNSVRILPEILQRVAINIRD